MTSGIPYDSREGRAICGALTAIMTGVAYATSAEMALRSFAEERGLELRSVLDAPSLADLIDLRSQEEDPTEESEDDGRDSTVTRQRISWLY